jgi:hypothetical protein
MQKAVSVLICWLLASSMGYAQSDWSAVTALSPGTRLRIESVRGGEAKGLLRAVDDGQLILQGKPPAKRADISKVEQLGDRQTGRFAKRGFLIGGVLGGTIGYFRVESSKGLFAAWMTVNYGFWGAVIGAIDGAQSRERTIIYKAP